MVYPRLGRSALSVKGEFFGRALRLRDSTGCGGSTCVSSAIQEAQTGAAQVQGCSGRLQTMSQSGPRSDTLLKNIVVCSCMCAHVSACMCVVCAHACMCVHVVCKCVCACVWGVCINPHDQDKLGEQRVYFMFHFWEQVYQ